MARVKIISVSEIKTHAFVNENTFDSSFISDEYIYDAQEGYLRIHLGDNFYEQIVEQVDNSTLTANNESLLDDYIKPYLAYVIKSIVALEVSNQIKNTGVVNINGSNFSSKDSKKSYRLAFQMAENLLYVMKKYLSDNSSSYPLWEDESSSSIISKTIIL